MAKTDIQIVAEIKAYVGNDGYGNWYAGIAADPKTRLFTDHNVSEQNGRWIYEVAVNEQHARSAEKLLLNDGFNGGDGGGDNSTVWVYAYRKTPDTRE
ncbi:MAG: hypothetical protein ACI9BF_000809 [Candidatus Paceibacteria bacterium]|jgi:hypothetical protein